MRIRGYRDTDLAALARVFTDSVHALGAPHYDDAQRAAWAPEPPDLAEWARRLAPLETLVAEEECALLGFLSFTPAGHVELLFTAPAAARRGVAAALHSAAESSLRARGVRALTTEASLVARPFFERQGYAVVEEQRVTRRGASFRRFAMKKLLAGAPEPPSDYDPERAPDPEAWLALSETERLLLVEAHHESDAEEHPDLERHCLLRATLETQLALDAPPAVRATLARLCARGLSRATALEAMGEVLHELMYRVALGAADPGDPNEQYARMLERIDARAWGGR